MIGVIVNPRSGYVKKQGVAQVREEIQRALPDARVVILDEHDDVGARCRELLAAGATCVAAVGGDGTVGSVAAELVDREIPLGVVPGGTLNHFSRDVGVGRDVPEALAVLAEGYNEAVDVATVNDRVFLNNSSLGLYPEMVSMREREAGRMSKPRALLHAALLAFRRTRWTEIEIATDDGDNLSVRTRLLFIGNNPYELDPLRLGRRKSLQDGVLSCFVLDAGNRVDLARALLGAVLGAHRPNRFFRSVETTELRVSPRQKCDLDVSTDGEVHCLTTPLTYRLKPRALLVVVPKPS